MSEKIGMGIITYKRPEYFKNCYNSIPWNLVDVGVVVNDGPEYDLKEIEITLNDKCTLIQHPENYRLAKTKNDAISFLHKEGCDHIFIIEDDTIITNENIFDKYIKASKKSGIGHFNFGPGTPFNLEQQPNVVADIHNRHLLNQSSKPTPRLVVNYGGDVKISLFTHCAAPFVYYSRQCIDEVGLMDESFNENAWEHVEHTYRITKTKHHPPFWWFADVEGSELLVSSQKDAIQNSSIATETSEVPFSEQEWTKKVMRGRELYKKKHGHYPNEPAFYSESQTLEILKNIKKNNV